jgi:hypothetical protein
MPMYQVVVKLKDIIQRETKSVNTPEEARAQVLANIDHQKLTLAALLEAEVYEVTAEGKGKRVL